MESKAPFAKCNECPLNARQFCPSSIPSGASVIVVGEAPGVDEVIEGAPFIGASGKVLESALTYVGTDWATVAKTNAVLCRPMIDPTTGSVHTPLDAVIACSERLAYDIQCAGAKNIIVAGNAAMFALDHLAESEYASTGGVMARAGTTYNYNVTTVYDDADGNPYGVREGDERISLVNMHYKYTPVVNPAYLLRNDEYMPTYLRHLELGVNPRARDFSIDRVKYAVMTPENMVRIVKYINSFEDGAPCAFDVETDHLQWYTTASVSAAPLLCLVLTFEDWRSIIIPAQMLADEDVNNTIRDVLTRYHIIAHNGKFDQNVMLARSGMGFALYDDTMLMHYTLYELGSHGLKELATEYLGAPDYETEYIDDWFTANGIKKADRRYSLLPCEHLYKYAAIDGVVTLQLWRIFDSELKAKGLYDKPYRETIMRVANALVQVEQTGIGIDRRQLTEAGIIFQASLAQIEDQMSAIVAPLVEALPDDSELKRLMRGKRKADRNTYTYNPRSNPQTSAIIYGLLDLKLNKRLIKVTGTNTGKDALEALPQHPFIDLLRHHRRVAKMFDTYVASIQRRLTIEDILHVDFRITGTEIGRLSASNGDHGIPRADDLYGAMIRSMFTADPNNLGDDDNNEVLVIGDYSQAELRAFAHLADVAFLKEKYRNGDDVHTETALLLESAGAPIFAGFAEAFAIVHNPLVHAPDVVQRAKAFVKRLRVFAKNINFGNIYQGGAMGISGMIGGAVPVGVVASVLKVYHRIMPETHEYAVKQFELLKRQGYVTTVFGRRRRFYVINDANRDEAQKAVVHMVVAGSAADCTNVSTAILVENGVRICHSVHDSLIARAKRCEAHAVASMMNDVMCSVGNTAMPSIPWVVDIEYTDDGSGVLTYPRRWVPKPDRALYDASGKLRAA